MNEEIKQIRILDYLHIASSKLSNDSNFLLHRFLIKYLKKYYPNNFHFYLTYPKSEENLNIIKKFLGKYNNVTPIPIHYFSTNAFFRNTLDWESMNNMTKTYDIILNNTPEIAFELLSYSISKGVYCGIMNYAHWFPKMINEPIFANYLGNQSEKYCIEMKYYHNFLLSNNNFTNSDYGNKQIIEGYKKIVGEEKIKNISDTIDKLYITVDHEEIDEYKNSDLVVPDCPVLIFNHRHQVYTGFTEFMVNIKKLIEIRPNLKFKIFVSDGGNMDLRDKFQIPEEYMLNIPNNSYKDYINILWKVKGIQMGTHIGQNQWSLSFLDGMFTNNLPFYRKNIFFDELFKNIEELRPFSYSNENEFVEKLIFLLENYDHYSQEQKRFYNHFRENWTWDTLVHKWAESFNKVYNETRIYKNSEKVKLFNPDYPITWNNCKKVLNISDQRPTNQYRSTLKEVHNLKEDMDNADPVFYRKDQKIKKTVGFF